MSDGSPLGRTGGMSRPTPASPSSLPIACRFVPTDQWLVTHLQPSWSIAQVKQCLLARFLPGRATARAPICPAAKRRTRPLSPITFGTDAGASNGSDSDSELDLDARYLKFKYTPSPSAPVSATPASPPPPNQTHAEPQERYALIAFSTGQLLEDHFTLAWYAFRAFELLELHAGPGLVALPRAIVDDYVRPYFEARVWALRVVPEASGDVLRKRRAKRKEDDQGEEYAKDAQKERGRRRKMEWRDRWLVIHRGTFRLCNHRNDLSPAHTSSLSALLALRGVEHLQPHLSRRTHSPKRPPSPRSPATPVPIPLTSPSRTPLISPALQPRPRIQQQHPSSPGDESDTESEPHGPSRIVCAKFRVYPVHLSHGIHPRSSFGALQSTVVEERRSLDGGAWWRRGSRDEVTQRGSHVSVMDEGHDEEGREEDQAVWVIMDMLTDEAYNNVLRILHRDAPRACISSFLSPDAPNPLSQPTPTLEFTFPTAPVPLSRTSPPFSASPKSISQSTDPVRANSQHTHGQRRSESTTGTSSKPACLYPEWRLTIVNRARRAGLGDIGQAMGAWIFGAEGPTDHVKEAQGRAAEGSNEGSDELDHDVHVGDADPLDPDPDADDPMWTGSRPDVPLYLAGDLPSDDSSDEGRRDSDADSEREWQAWAEDLPRQHRTRVKTRPRKPSVHVVEKRVSVVFSSAWAYKGEGSQAQHAADSSPRPPSPPRMVASYSSMESLLWHASRSPPLPARTRTRTRSPGPSADGSTLSSSLPALNARPRSPLARMDDAPFSSYMPPDYEYEDVWARPQSYESGSRGAGAKVVIPTNMAMTTITSTVSVGPSAERKGLWRSKGKDKEREKDKDNDPDKKAKKLTKDKGQKEKTESTQPPSQSHALAPFLRPTKLKLSMGLGTSATAASSSSSAGTTLALPAPAPVSAVSMTSIESVRFVTPDLSD